MARDAAARPRVPAPRLLRHRMADTHAGSRQAAVCAELGLGRPVSQGLPHLALGARFGLSLHVAQLGLGGVRVGVKCRHREGPAQDSRVCFGQAVLDADLEFLLR